MSNNRNPPGAMMAQYDKFVSIFLISLGLTACGGGGGGGDNQQTPPITYSLSITNDLYGSITILNQTSGASQTCAAGATCNFNFNENTQLSLTVTPQTQYRSGNWSGDCTGNTSCSLLMTSNRSVSHVYEYLPASDRACIETTPAPAIPDISWQPITTGLNNPLSIASADDFSGRLFIVEQAGTVRTVTNGVLDAGSFLDISNRVINSGTSVLNLSGLLSIAFHPQFASNGLFYVYYISTNVTTIISDPQCATSNLCVIVAEFDNNAMDVAASQRILLDIPMTTGSHLGGQLAFGPEAIPMLYVSTGDGNSFAAANHNSYAGKILRIDINSQDIGLEYSIPADNPAQLAESFSNTYVSNNGRHEIWAYGFLNPRQFSFDVLTGNLYLADNSDLYGNPLQEINQIQAGLFYGWDNCTGTEGTGSVLCETFDGSGNTQSSTLYQEPPIWMRTTFDSPAWNALIGGAIYRGSQYADLCGVYIAGDFNDGKIIGLRFDNGSITEQKDLTVLSGVIAFGMDQDMEIYAISRSTGTLYQLTVP